MKYITIITIIFFTIVILFIMCVVDEIRRQRKINNKLRIEQELMDKITDKIKNDFAQKQEVTDK